MSFSPLRYFCSFILTTCFFASKLLFWRRYPRIALANRRRPTTATPRYYYYYYYYKDPALCGDLCCLCSYYCLRLHVFIDPKTAPPSAVVPLRIPTPAPISILCCLVFFFIVPVSIVVVVVGQCRS